MNVLNETRKISFQKRTMLVRDRSPSSCKYTENKSCATVRSVLVKEKVPMLRLFLKIKQLIVILSLIARRQGR